MLIAVVNNLPELILGTVWTTVVFTTGAKFGRWRQRRNP